jgi:2-polyprenyl-3-methyl-5-hydroxy-6-metoxy-1,4-benzoquinol methylase
LGDIERNLRAAAQGLQYDSIADAIATRNPSSVLDWGCGWGQVSDRLLRRGVAVTAFDYRPAEPEGRAPLERFPEIICVHSPESVALPFDDQSFELVLSCGVLEHVSNPIGSLREIHRILQPGGSFLVYNLPNRYSYLERIAKAGGAYYHGQLPDDRVYTPASASKLLREAGFSVGRIKRMNMLPLSIPHPILNRVAPATWRASKALSRVPGLNLVATTLEFEATK